ncbi:hypothetical protein CK503_11165 [Aliifodinibius salipaludis]|uniref:Uncharacterized protein n=1 Tax=Fodinibius salipaludis TaxID=2032627 RepID=A0A2A2GA10_9BACT|nr:DUF6577 family protein [Aliifodinibius salipaludis]PAU93703.1 hypothetical protein CK503_11165 [Aliifodinibius salipaludis]
MAETFYIEELENRFRDQKTVSIEELYQFYKEKEPDLPRSTLRWRIYELNNKAILSRVKRGVYKLGSEVREWKPDISKELKTITSKLQNEFLYLTFCIWSTKWLLNFTQHLPTKYFTLVDTERDTEESVFYCLQDIRKDSGVFLNPSKDEVHKYLGSSENPLVVRSLISQSPLMTVNEIQVPKLEKIMVDLVADEVLFNAFQGKELKNIYSNIVNKYDVNLSTLKRYSLRRNKWDEVKEFLKETNEQILG